MEVTAIDLKAWSPDQVVIWLLDNDFGEYSKFFKSKEITGSLLLELDFAKLQEIGVVNIGERARILQAVKSQFLNTRKAIRPPVLESSTMGISRLNGNTKDLVKDQIARSKPAVSITPPSNSLQTSTSTSSLKSNSTGQYHNLIKSSSSESDGMISNYLRNQNSKSSDGINNLLHLTPNSPKNQSSDSIPKALVSLSHSPTTPTTPTTPIPRTSSDDLKEQSKNEPYISDRIQKLLNPFKKGKDKHHGKQSKRSKLQPEESLPKLSKFFGERPPTEMLVENLEEFFPAIATNALETKKPNVSNIKDMIVLNLDKKKHGVLLPATLMLRRKSEMVNLGAKNSSGRGGRPQAMYVEKVEIPITSPTSPGSFRTPINFSKSAVSSLPPACISPVMHTPLPVAFKWAQGPIIGQGAFGQVFHALNLNTGDFMAVKQIVTDSSPNGKKIVESIEREIAFLSEIDHINMVKFFGFEDTENTINIFLEYIDGGSISSVIKKCGKLEEDIARNFTCQILCGLEHLHSLDIIHRDIKGANILVTGAGVLKITDFGISKKNIHAAYNRMTRMSLQGTVNWMAPEVARGKGYSAKVDIWSAGCLALEMLTGLAPWIGVVGNIIYLLGTGNSPPIPAWLSPLSAGFLKLTFEIDPEKRPTASDLLNDSFTDLNFPEFKFMEWCAKAIVLKSEKDRELALLAARDSNSEDSSSDNDSSRSSSEEILDTFEITPTQATINESLESLEKQASTEKGAAITVSTKESVMSPFQGQMTEADVSPHFELDIAFDLGFEVSFETDKPTEKSLYFKI